MLNSIFLEIFVAIRYLRGQGRTVIFSLGTRLSFLFMALVVSVMVIVLSVFTGFQNEVHKSLWNSGYHITISMHGRGKTIKNHEN
ncbi:MAG: ABC transporter permease, partial [Spirochaetia bacterium]|nr:ABC transporter permease [Spirochaetia bacterium]